MGSFHRCRRPSIRLTAFRLSFKLLKPLDEFLAEEGRQPESIASVSKLLFRLYKSLIY